MGRVRIYTRVDHSVRLRARFVQQASFRCTGNCFFEASCATICLQPAVLTFVKGFFFYSVLPAIIDGLVSCCVGIFSHFEFSGDCFMNIKCIKEKIFQDCFCLAKKATADLRGPVDIFCSISAPGAAEPSGTADRKLNSTLHWVVAALLTHLVALRGEANFQTEKRYFELLTMVDHTHEKKKSLKPKFSCASFHSKALSTVSGRFLLVSCRFLLKATFTVATCAQRMLSIFSTSCAGPTYAAAPGVPRLAMTDSTPAVSLATLAFYLVAPLSLCVTKRT